MSIFLWFLPYYLLAVAMATAISVHKFCEVIFFSSKGRTEISLNKASQLEQTTICLVYLI